MTSTSATKQLDLVSGYRLSGQASSEAGTRTRVTPADVKGVAFFDVDNTIMRGSSLFHMAMGLMRHRYFRMHDMAGFAIKQVKYVMSGSENLEDMQSAITAGLSFVAGKPVAELVALGEQIFDESMLDKLIPGSLALAKAHLDAGEEVWLITATPIELAALIASRLGLSGALGTVAEVHDGIYTGHLVGPPLHGMAKADAVRALAAHEGIDLRLCAAYSDSVNDLPMLSAVGRPVAVNPDSALRAHAREHGWPIHDFRRREHLKRFALPAAAAVTGAAVGYALARSSRRR